MQPSKMAKVGAANTLHRPSRKGFLIFPPLRAVFLCRDYESRKLIRAMTAGSVTMDRSEVSAMTRVENK